MNVIKILSLSSRVEMMGTPEDVNMVWVLRKHPSDMLVASQSDSSDIAH